MLLFIVTDDEITHMQYITIQYITSRNITIYSNILYANTQDITDNMMEIHKYTVTIYSNR